MNKSKGVECPYTGWHRYGGYRVHTRGAEVLVELAKSKRPKKKRERNRRREAIETMGRVREMVAAAVEWGR